MENLKPGEELELTKYNKGTSVYIQRRTDRKRARPLRKRLLKAKRTAIHKERPDRKGRKIPRRMKGEDGKYHKVDRGNRKAVLR